MPKLLIADATDNFIETLNKALCSDWEIHIAKSNIPVYDQLLTIQPNALLLNLGLPDNTPAPISAKHLDALGIRPNLSGYRCLLIAIQLFSQNRNLLLKEIYPDVSTQCGLNDATCVERVIRSAIRDAWNHGSKEIWNAYFPRHTHCPSNKEFIATLSDLK